ncbi:MAG: hypothetical protein AAGF55_01035 [Pseudomonadota bacterium]
MTRPRQKPILCLDFDGVIHSYTSGWKGADVIPDPPVPGALRFIVEAMDHFELSIYSSRSGQHGGISAMQEWLSRWFYVDGGEVVDGRAIVGLIQWPTEKPPAMITIDDRAITFTGEWPEINDLLSFKPWNKRNRW